MTEHQIAEFQTVFISEKLIAAMVVWGMGDCVRACSFNAMYMDN